MIAMKSSLVASLTSSADAVVDQVLLHGSSGMLAAPRFEVGFVAAVTLGGVPGIASEWSRLLRPFGLKLEMHGVFCHAAPVVEFQTARSSKIGCELADLLVVIDYLGLNGQIRRRASLIQAKMASKATFAPAASNRSANDRSDRRTRPSIDRSCSLFKYDFLIVLRNKYLFS